MSTQNKRLATFDKEMFELVEQIALGSPIGEFNRDMDSLLDIARWIEEKHGENNSASRRLKWLHRQAESIIAKATNNKE